MEEFATVIGWVTGRTTAKSVEVRLEPLPKKAAYIPRTMLAASLVAPPPGFSTLRVSKHWLKLTGLGHLALTEDEVHEQLRAIANKRHPLQPVTPPGKAAPRREDASW